MYFYIDPGTGSMLFTVLIALMGSLVYLFRNLKVKMGSLARRDRAAEKESAAEPLVIYSDHRRYWVNFAPLCEELERRQQRTLYLTASQDDPVFDQPFRFIRAEYIGEGNKGFARLNFLHARVVLSTTPSLDVYQWKRSRDVGWYVHLPHAPNDITLYRMFGIDYYDALLLSGAYQETQVRQLEALRGLPAKEIRLVGLPYMDEMKKRLAALPSGTGEKRTVLLAPSWGESAILRRYGSRMLDALLRTGYHLIIRPHPQSFSSEKEMIEDLMARYPESEQLEWNRDSDNFEVLSRSDLLISDFSGVIFDFALVFDRPVMYADTSFDPGPYDCWWLQEETWTFRILPKIGMHLTEEDLPRLKEAIDACIESPAFRQGREEARAETWVYPGEGARRAVDYLMEKLQGEQPEGEQAAADDSCGC